MVTRMIKQKDVTLPSGLPRLRCRFFCATAKSSSSRRAMPPRTVNVNRPSSNGSSGNGSSGRQTLTVRPFATEPAAPKALLRIHLHKSALAALGLRSGDLCCLSIATDDDEPAARFPVIAWETTDPRLPRHVVNVSQNVRKWIGVGLDKKINVENYAEDVEKAGRVVLREVDAQDGLLKDSADNMTARDREGWPLYLRTVLFDMKFVTEGLTVGQVEYMGVKRVFKIDKIVSSKADGNPGTVATISAYRVTSASDVEVISAQSKTRQPTLSPTQRKQKRQSTDSTRTTGMAASGTTFASIGGLDPQINRLRTELLSALHQSHHFARVCLKPPRGILLYGPPGTGKTLILRAVASEIKANAFVINGSVVGKYMGESEAAVRKVFAEARKNQPAIVFIDEVDSLAPKRTDGEGSEGRVVATLLTEMDGMEASEDGGPTKVVVVAATNRPNAIDLALRRPGRFDKEIEIGIPDVGARRKILDLLMKEIPFEGEDGRQKTDFIKALAERTHGFVGADLENLVRGGFTIALKRVGIGSEETTATESSPSEEEPILRESDLEAALKEVRPTAMREVFLEPPNVRWSDIGGQEEVKQRLREAVEWPLKHEDAFKRLGGTPRKGILLYGPPGCSKTLTAKALATEAGVNFMAVKGPELFSMYVGQSEAKVREVFRKARAASPSIIFFDEIDALSASREGHKGGGVNVLTALLNEMDGIEALKNVVVLAATNRPEIIDPALMRPGRLDTILYVGPPDAGARRQILRIKTAKMSVGADVDVDELADRMDGFSGAEIVNACDEAIHAAMRESFDIDAVGRRHFDEALAKAVPQITEKMRTEYEQWSVGGVKKI